MPVILGNGLESSALMTPLSQNTCNPFHQTGVMWTEWKNEIKDVNMSVESVNISVEDGWSDTLRLGLGNGSSRIIWIQVDNRLMYRPFHFPPRIANYVGILTLDNRDRSGRKRVSPISKVKQVQLWSLLISSRYSITLGPKGKMEGLSRGMKSCVYIMSMALIISP
jgi:hypothetical protein